MITTTLSAPSSVELELMLGAAALGGSPAEHGRRRAQRVTDSLALGLGAVAAAIAAFDLALLLGGV